MGEIEFNLFEQPWIQIMLPDCRMREVSLADALIHAHEYRDLAGEMAAQDIAILRMMIALVHTAISRLNLVGEEEPIEDEAMAMDRWKEIWSMKHFPESMLHKYIDTWRYRFWLFHPERPFYQVPLTDGTENTAAKLNGEVSESNNKYRLFSMLSSAGKKSMSFAEAARWLLFLNGFDDCAAKQRDKSQGHRSMSMGWLGKLGLVMVVGGNLFETIMLNMPMLNADKVLWTEDDLPVWEYEKVHSEERATISMPENLAELYTLQSRRILLKRTDERVTGYLIMGGDAFEDIDAFSEPMTLWSLIEDKKTIKTYFRPRRHDRSRQLWRDFGVLTVDTDKGKYKTGVVDWYSTLRNQRLIGEKARFRTVCARYDSSQFSSITDSFSDSLSFHADLLESAGKVWREEIIHQVKKVEDTAGCIDWLASDLAKAAGQDEKGRNGAENTAKEELYGSIDMPFREWLMKLNPEQSSDEMNALIQQWEKEAYQIATMQGKQMVMDKGDVAFVGRTLEEKKKSHFYSSPQAYRMFQHNIRKVYPNVNKGEDENAK